MHEDCWRGKIDAFYMSRLVSAIDPQEATMETYELGTNNEASTERDDSSKMWHIQAGIRSIKKAPGSVA